MSILKIAEEFENRKHSLKNTSDRIRASREAKEIILALNEIYKMGHDPRIMEVMKRLTVVKKKIEKRLKFNHSV
jgi:hypothetical protein